MTRNDFAVFIITHARAEKQLTFNTLKKGNYSGKVYFIVDDEDPELELYQNKYGSENVKIFKKCANFDLADNLLEHKSVPVYARNECFKMAQELGIKYFVQLDDDYPKISYRFVKNNKFVSKPIKNFDLLFDAMCRFIEQTPIYCCAFAVDGDYIGGANGQYKNGLCFKARNSFFCCVNKNFEFLGRFNEDATTPAINNMLGRLFFTNMHVQVTRYNHERNTGGSSNQYKAVSWYWIYFYQILFIPSAVKLTLRKGDFISKISKDNLFPKIINERWRKNNAE